MRKRIFFITAIIIFVLTLILILVTLLVQPALSPPWNNLLILFGVALAAALAALSGITDTWNWVEKLMRRDQIQAPLLTGDQIIIIAEQVSADFWRQFRTPPADLQGATTRYLRHLINRYQFLDFKGMGVYDKAPLKLPLLDMYIPLKARVEMPEGETWARELRLAGRPVSEEEAADMGPRLSEPRPVLELLQQNDGLIILGDPGAGKSTFLKYLALRLALGEGTALGLGARLPVLLPLSAYATALADGDLPLHDFMARHYQNSGVDEPLRDLLDAALRRGGALLLLDGLDEVRSVERRHTVVARVEDFFAYWQQYGNKFVLTSRIVGYREARPTGTRMAECTLVDFDAEEIARFVTQWTAALEREARGENEVAAWEAAQESAGLLNAIQHNPGVRRLAANPLLLTILALMKRQGVELPERRVELYDRYVHTLLRQWNLARSLAGRSGYALDEREAEELLAPLALWMHETSPGVGMVLQEAVQRQLTAMYAHKEVEKPDRAAYQFLEEVRGATSLLVERGQGAYGFIHLTFQEYLAAVGIAQQGQGDVARIVAVLREHVGQDNWHEVLLLTIGYLGIIQRLPEPAGKVLLQLMADAPGEAGEAVVFAGEAVVDARSGGVTPACRQQVIAALQETMTAAGQVAPPRRARAGRALARLDDPRRAIMDVDAMPFCYVPEGLFGLGDEQGRDDEKPVKQVMLRGYWLAQYPVSQAQFAQFVAAGGYGRADFWPEAAARGYWQDGRFKGRWDDEWRSAPYDFGLPYALPNHPVVGVSWYEAVAFCRWLTQRWRRILPAGWQARLPAEPEWEKGAKGGVEIVERPLVRTIGAGDWQPRVTLAANPAARRRYPWGEGAVTAERANYAATGIQASSAIGCFPGNESPYGCREMSGNVWEWTLSKYGQYPYTAAEREGVDSSDSGRVVRGGAYWNDEEALRCAYRLRNLPLPRYGGRGFRVCVSPFSTSDL
ncbi:MAG: SUMF1/EgtB/PvdO family nonheme iron enzyme [Anaerolineales bacterium]|nr:SUMF1/EgtB/PvdO family nonheme iron enzyme [Anaerolineales bacterium]